MERPSPPSSPLDPTTPTRRVVPLHVRFAASGPPCTDVELIQRMAAGDEQALGALYDRWSSRAFSFALHLLGDEFAAEEVVEETFWQVWQSAARYDENRGEVGTWLLTVTRSRALDRLRADQRKLRSLKQVMQLADAVAPSPGPEESALEDAISDEHRELVYQAMAELPPEQRDVVELAFFGGLSHLEIAEQTGQPLGTVKTRMRLALYKLRDRLQLLREDG